MATKPQFTPGPWRVSYDDANGQAVVAAEHIEIATCWHHCVGSIEQEMRHNANLIASAPKLYSALQVLASLMEEVRDDAISARMGFGATQGERRERVRILTAYIEENADKLDDALDAAAVVLTEALQGETENAEQVPA